MSRRTPKPSNVIPLTHHTAVRQDTGEVFDFTTSARVGRRKRSKKKMFALVDLEVLESLELSAGEWRVLRRIMRGTNPETNQAPMSLVEIADDTGLARPYVSAIMRDLRVRNVVFTLRRGVHRVNAHIMYRGSNADWDIATDTEPEPIWRRA